MEKDYRGRRGFGLETLAWRGFFWGVGGGWVRKLDRASKCKTRVDTNVYPRYYPVMSFQNNVCVCYTCQ